MNSAGPSSPSPSSSLGSLDRPDGRISYEVTGSGPLVVLVPGMGDLRSSYRHLTPALVAAGYRVACTDLRGHGDSDTTFASYGDTDTASDLTALIQELGGPAVIVGNSMGAGAAVMVAAEHPELVSGLALLGPWVRNGSVGALKMFAFRMAMGRPWIVPVWKGYLPKLYAGAKPADFGAYRDQLIANLRRPGYATAFSRTTRTDHAPAEACLPRVTVPTTIVMGDLDPDFPDPAAEAAWIAKALHGEAVMVAQAGHYPQSQQPEATATAVLRLLGTVHGVA